MIKPCQKYRLIGVLILCASFSFTYQHIHAQAKAEIKQQAESQLGQMTPDEIDAKIKQYGLTREQADAKAKELGIDLSTYLQRRSTNAVTPAATSVKVEVTPVETKPAATLDSVQPVESPTPPKEKPPITGAGGLPYFGYNIFKTVSSAFEPRPVLDEQYLIGEGDVLSISLWGELQSYSEHTVGKEGRILVSSVGPIYVSGYSLEKVRGIVQNAMGKAYAGLKKSPPSIFMDLSVARIRPLRIFAMGEVENPGGYSVSPFANVFNSLFSFGGAKLSGSLREIRVIRNNRIVNKVDIYDYLIGTEKTNDFRINDNDIIYVPLRERTVGIKGAVLRSAYFELLPNENLKQLIEFSGGIRTTIYLQRIQVDRIVPFAERKKGEPDRKIFDIDLSEFLKSGKDYKLEDGDIVTIFPILDEKKNFVTLDGAVWRPGLYQLEKISKLKDLIKEANGLLPDVYPDRAMVTRTFEDRHFEVFYINIGRAMQGDPSDNFTLEPRDNIRIYTRDEILATLDNVTVEGMAKRPGKYPLYLNRNLYDIVYDAVGLTDTLFRKQVYLPRADLVRLNEDRYTSRIVTFDLWALFQSRKGDTLLLPGDRVIIYPIGAIEFTDRYVDIAGKVKTPGRYKLSENMTLFDLLIQAGGYTEDAWPVHAEVARLERTGIGQDSLVRITMANIPDLFDTSKTDIQSLTQFRAMSLPLQHRDQVFIRPNPNYVFQQSVTVEGDVVHSGNYVISKLNERLSDVVKRAGGLKKSGYAEGGKVIRSGTRLRINVYDAIDDPEGDNDIKLHPGDIISIPSSPFSVIISGEVNNPGIFSFVDGKKLSFYLDESGGKTDSAEFALLTLPTGMVEKVGLHWWSSNPKIPDGSSVFVAKEKPAPIEPPEKEGQKVTVYDVVKDMTAIMVSTLTVILLINQINK